MLSNVGDNVWNYRHLKSTSSLKGILLCHAAHPNFRGRHLVPIVHLHRRQCINQCKRTMENKCRKHVNPHHPIIYTENYMKLLLIFSNNQSMWEILATPNNIEKNEKPATMKKTCWKHHLHHAGNTLFIIFGLAMNNNLPASTFNRASCKYSLVSCWGQVPTKYTKCASQHVRDGFSRVVWKLVERVGFVRLVSGTRFQKLQYLYPL